MAFKAVLFDMDGVLVNTEEFYNARRFHFLQEKGLGPGYMLDFSGYSANQMWEELIPEDAHLREKIKAEYHEIYSKEHPTPWKELAAVGLFETLAELKKRGLKLALCSSSDRLMIDNMLESLGLTEAFDLTLSGQEVSAYKPNPAIYLEAASRLDIDKLDCLVIEDSPIGIEAGVASSAFVVAIRKKNMDQSKANKIIDNLFELTKLL